MQNQMPTIVHRRLVLVITLLSISGVAGRELGEPAEPAWFQCSMG